MHGKPRSRLPSGLARAFLLLAVLLLSSPAHPAAARELRRQMPFLRPLLMGDAYVAVGDESTALFYNPAGLARLKEGTIEISPFHFGADKELAGVLLDSKAVQAKYNNLTLASLQNLVGTSLYFDVSLRLPFITATNQGAAYGIGAESMGAAEVVLDSLGLPAIQLELFVDETALWSLYGQFGNLSLGVTGKVINRVGIDKTIGVATLFANGGVLDLKNDPDWVALTQGKAKTRTGLDLGMIYQFPGAENWQPRFGISVLNLGQYDSKRGFVGIEFGAVPDPDTPPLYGRLPLITSIGFAVSPTFAFVRYTLALDVVDVGRTAIPGKSLSNRTRVGFEAGVGPHDDGTALFSLLCGWNATHFSVGILSRVTIFEIGFGRYTVEKGDKPNADPEERRVLLIAFRF